MTISVVAPGIGETVRGPVDGPAGVGAATVIEVQALQDWDQEFVDLIFEEIVEANFADEGPVPRRPRPGTAPRWRRHDDGSPRGIRPCPSTVGPRLLYGYVTPTGGRGRGPPAAFGSALVPRAVSPPASTGGR